MYYNTANDSGETLKTNVAKSETNLSKVKAFFEENPNQEYTKSEVRKNLIKQGKIHPQTLESTIATALTVLKDEGFLRKLDAVKIGSYGRNCRKWVHVSVDSSGQMKIIF